MTKAAMAPVTGRAEGPPIHRVHGLRHPLIDGKSQGGVTHDLLHGIHGNAMDVIHDPTVMSRICGDCDAKHSDRSENAEKCFHTIEGVLLHPMIRECSPLYSVAKAARCLHLPRFEPLKLHQDCAFKKASASLKTPHCLA